ncbi:MAG: hypothetical protein ACYDEQ_05615 [Desulfocucumaceae bacterium]
MADKKDKQRVKAEGIDVSGYMPGPISPYPPMMPDPPCKPGPISPYPPGQGCPEHHEHMEMNDTLACKLRMQMGQQVTVYVMGMGPTGPVSVIPTGVPIVTEAGTMGITGILHHVGMDYLELHVMMGGNMRVVYIPIMAIASVVPVGPLLPEADGNFVTTVPAL